MKKIIVSIFIIAMLMTMLTIPVLATGFTVIITPSKSSVSAGDTITLTVSLENLDVGQRGIDSFVGYLDYDTTKFEKVAETDIVSADPAWFAQYNEESKKMVAYTVKGDFCNQDTAIIKITLKVKSNVELGATEIKIRDVEVADGEIEVAGTEGILSISIKKISTGDYEIDDDDNITGISPGTDTDDFNDNVSSTGTITIHDKDGNIVPEGTLLGTGMVVKVDGQESYTIIVKGDLNGDGKVTITDLAKIRLHIVELKMLEGPYLKAAEVNGDGRVSLIDLSRIKQAVVGLIKL